MFLADLIRTHIDNTCPVQIFVEAVQVRDGVYCYTGHICSGMMCLLLDAIIKFWVHIFCMITLLLYNSAFHIQEAAKRTNSWLPPPWAIAALLILGFNEFMTVLRYKSLTKF